MATILRNTVIKNCGTVPVLIYETAPTTRVTILGLSFTNLTMKVSCYNYMFKTKIRFKPISNQSVTVE